MRSIEYSFIKQIEKAFSGAGLRPIFDVVREEGKWKLSKLKRLETKHPLEIYYPVPRTEDFLDLGFQRRFTDLIAKHPIRVGGRVSLQFKNPDTGEKEIINRIRWRVEVSKIKKIDVNEEGTLAIGAYELKNALFAAHTDKELSHGRDPSGRHRRAFVAQS